MTERAETIVDECERELRRWILEGEVRPGDRLPPERALAARLGVNRTTLRSALTRLTAARLVRVKQGSGYLVQDFRKLGGLELVPALARDDDGRLGRIAADLLRVRRALLAMALADLRQTLDAGTLAADAARLHQIAADHAPCEAIVDAENAIVATLLSGTASPVLMLSFNSLCAAARATPAICKAMGADVDAALRFVTALLSCAREPTPCAVEEALRALDARDATILAALDARGSAAAN